jgi:MinD-like ATPase involved in chromosome partitioning or flagellar assembly
VAVCSAKAGIGKSTVAANLAAALARSQRCKVVVVDLALQYGDQGWLHRTGDAPSIIDALEASRQDDDPRAVLPSLHRVGGVSVLPAPPAPGLAELVDIADVGVLLTKLRSLFDVIVVDTQSYIDNTTTWMLENADRLVLLTTPHPASIKNTILLLRTLGQLNVGGRALLVALNRVEPRVNMSVDRVEDLLRYPIDIEMPHAADALQESANRGRSLVVGKPAHRWSREVERLALMTWKPDAVAPRRRRTLLRGDTVVGGKMRTIGRVGFRATTR